MMAQRLAMVKRVPPFGRNDGSQDGGNGWIVGGEAAHYPSCFF